MGPEAEHIMNTYDPARADKYDEVIKMLDLHFALSKIIPRKNIIFERVKFRTRVQRPGENVETFI